MTQDKIALCLSGGGFRATLFHLGVITALRDLELLPRIGEIYSVSGGSILAAHLVLNWEQYVDRADDKFRTAAREVVKFTRHDVRGRIVRRWIVLGWARPFGRVQQLIRYYDSLYKHSLLQSLRGDTRPELYILATSMSSGDVCAFSPDGMLRNVTSDTKMVSIPELPISTAVAASSAFPPMFPPVELDSRVWGVTGGEMPNVERLTDGGVFDNLGVRAAVSRSPDGPFLISDASAAFTQEAYTDYSGLVRRTMKTTDILMSRVASLEQAQLDGSGLKVYFASIGATVKSSDIPKRRDDYDFALQSQAIQKWVKYVRTDLD